MTLTTTGREWGPARRDPADPYGRRAVEQALDQRDGAERIVDDN